MSETPKPGVSRTQRISDEGLARLQKQLSAGPRMSKPVRAQWIARYGDAARRLFSEHGIEDTD